MSTRRKKLLLLGFSLAACISILLICRESEPRYGGHSLSYWVTCYADNNMEAEDAKRTDEVIRHIGTNAMPYLLKWISEAPSESDPITKINRRIGQLNQTLYPKADWTLGNSSIWLRYGSIRAFAALGSQAEPAIPALKRILNESPSENARIIAAESLRLIGKTAILALTGALTNSNANVRQEAASMILRLGPETEFDVPALIHALDDTNSNVKQVAYFFLRRVPDPAVIVPLMMRRVESDDQDAKMMAISALAQYGFRARSALPGLLSVLGKAAKSNDIGPYQQIIWAIQQIDPQSLTNVPRLPPTLLRPEP